ncbi:alpha/beta fold hydrolase [Corynebacterium sp. sy017]|uniref:polyketide synthase Pks13 n=1 Tax=unclassified Corynebacterium TaxID=2624378 RepID=UPI0011857088|nr:MULTISPECIES: polyketide synthase Pks13 [unclassified Corynebacterium]MBP3088525.1 alpha/beta fold hydrolase [Corynebacterium sp. sy017]TSD92092.1 alpha/beta fold hydrolase [Corynebacterium sp. SY003]
MTTQELQAWLRDWVIATTGLASEEVNNDSPMQAFGLSSRDVVVLSGELENLLGISLDPTIAYEYPTITALARFLTVGQQEEPQVASAQHNYQHFAGNSSDPADRDIAIVGMAARYPGAEDVEAFWEMLINGQDAITQPPAQRWAAYADDTEMQHRMAAQNLSGGYLADISSFDAEFFGLSPLEAVNIDPQQRIMLELTWRALEHAHIPPSALRGESVGVFIGSTNNDYGMLIAADTAEAHPYALTGTASSIIANRISYAFDFRGPSINVDTACSSSLVSTHHAIKALRGGEVDLAVAGGVNILASPFVSTAFGELGVFSPTSKIHAFSDDADGFVRSDGAGVVILKRVRDALADGDHILAVLKGSAVNSDGHSNGLTAPNPDAQVDVLRRAYADAGVDPQAIDYVEAHGTGTILGDPIEANAIGSVLGTGRSVDKPTLLGSVKTNIGHTESAAGVAGLLKTVLAMQHNVLPSSLNYTEPNRYVDFDAHHLEVVADPREWPEYSGKKLAGVSAFGFGGTNAHVVVSEFDHADYAAESAQDSSTDTALYHDHQVVSLPISGLLPSRRARAAQELATFLDTCTDSDLVGLARSLARRNHGRSRAVVLADSVAQAQQRLRTIADGKISTGIYSADAPSTIGPVFVYSGFGSQHRKMVKELVEYAPQFRARLAQLDEIVEFESGWSILNIVADDEQTYNTETAQVAITAIQIALTDYLGQLGVKPAAVMGMSMGEIAAAYAAGGLNAHDAMRIACHRARLMGEGEQSLPEDQLGAMAVVELSAEDLDSYADIEPAVYAAPGMTTVGGPRAAVVALVEALEAEGKFARLLNVKGAGHTSAVEPLLGELAAEIADITPQPVHTTLFSSVDRGVVYAPGAIVHTSDYWLKCTREAVWFQDATEQAFGAGHTTLIEISPHPVALMGMMSTAFSVGKPDAQLLYVLKRKESVAQSLHDVLAKLYVAGQPVDYAALYGRGDMVSAPYMSWKKNHYWTAARPRSGGGSAFPGKKIVLPDGTKIFATHADQVPTSAQLLQAVSQEIAPGARLIAEKDYAALPSSGELTTVASQNIAGWSIKIYHVLADDTTTLLSEGFCLNATADIVAEHAPRPVLNNQEPIEKPAEHHAESEQNFVWDRASGQSIEERMRIIVSEAMGYDVEDLPGELPLIDLGLDSLMGMRIKNRIEHDFAIPELNVQALRDASVADAVALVETMVAAKESAQPESVQQHSPAQEQTQQVDSAAPAPAPHATGVATGVGVAPRDASERLVFATWAGITGAAAAGVTSPLPDITQEIAEDIAQRLTQRSGADISPAHVLEARTLEPLANRVREALETEVEGNIRVLRPRQEGSTAPALFMFHPAGGSSVVYQPLMRRLPVEIPVYGVERLEGSLEERAAAYLDEIKEYSQGYPVVLGGWSFGGALAYEVAHQLRDSDVEIITIALLDTVSPKNPIPDTPEETKRRWERYSAFAKKTYGLEIPVPYELLETQGEDALLAMMAEFLATTDASEHGLSAGVLEHQRASFVDNRILDRMDMNKWADVHIPVMLFRAERMHDGAIELEPAYAEIAEDGGWRSIVKDLEIIHLKGDHLAVVDEPEIAKVGRALSERIATLQGQQAESAHTETKGEL